MTPSPADMVGEESGIKRVVEAYYRYLPALGVEFVTDPERADVTAAHITADNLPRLDVLHNHGLYWTADYRVPAEAWEHHVNAKIVAAARRAREITVPSAWVAEPFQRDMRVNPTVVGHGLDWSEWQVRDDSEGYVLWNKNRDLDVCSPRPVAELARRRPAHTYVSTFYPRDEVRPSNVTVTGVVGHEVMRNIVRRAGVYLATTKETFGIGILEAMASGVPVLGFAHGGAVDLVRHGVNGYLAAPGDWAGLADGLDYCWQHRKVLGDNGREMARAWTWERVAENVLAVYERAARPEPATVAIIIPCHNYGTEDKLGRALDSALSQSYRGVSIVVVVDDGSKDAMGVSEVCCKRSSERTEIRHIRQDCAGVAIARNRGIVESRSKYVVCLDADDALDPRFVEVCVGELERDRSIGIAYTRLQWVKPTGATGMSDWPGDCDHDAQFGGRNQVPTCCVFRREMWERLGGYKARYCPRGAGEEDAEFWLRAFAAGWSAKRVGEEALFIYSWGSGRVSGDRKHQATDWLAWHPWTKDWQYPFAATAKPRKRQAHPVRQYDEPEVSVVIPVGPGHEGKLPDALDSLEAQSFRKWEAVVVWDSPKNSFPLVSAYPYIRWVTHDQTCGAGKSRNDGVAAARAPLVLFLDADDYLAPGALEKMVLAHRTTHQAVYTDYIGLAFVDDPAKLDARIKVYQRDPDGWTAMGYASGEYDCARAQQQPVVDNPYTWNLITTLIPKAWHAEVGGFDEAMTTWEDVDYWWRMARQGKCFHHLREELVVYRFYTGHRRELGVSFQQDRERYLSVMGYMADKYAQMEKQMCSACPKTTSAPPPIPPDMRPLRPDTPQAKAATLADEDFVLVTYASPNRGDHPVQGARTGVRYGYRAGGDEFMVHRADIAAQPELFLPKPVAVPPASASTPTAPVALAPVEVDATPFLDKALDAISLPGVGAETIKQMMTEGYLTPRKLQALGAGGLTETFGIAKRKAALVMDYLGKMTA